MGKRIQYKAPFRIGKKQRRAILDANGKTVVVFRKGDEKLALHFCKLYNTSNESDVESYVDDLSDKLADHAFGSQNQHLYSERQALSADFANIIRSYLYDIRTIREGWEQITADSKLSAPLNYEQNSKDK